MIKLVSTTLVYLMLFSDVAGLSYGQSVYNGSVTDAVSDIE